MTGAKKHREGQPLMREIRSRHPRLREALLADARVSAAYRGERHEFHSRADAAIQTLRLIWESDAFLAQALYRVKARLQTLGIPVLPRVAHRLAIAIAQISIGDPVIVHPGVYIIHGQVVIDGFTEIHSGAVIGPFVTIGLREGEWVGPTVERNVTIGTGAKVLGKLRVGGGARIGANAVVIDDVAERTTAVGVPARALTTTDS
jgi:serine O-acetyltransferase